MSALPKNRTEAQRRGSRMYDSGNTCERGHLSPRYTGSGFCAACLREDYSDVTLNATGPFEGTVPEGHEPLVDRRTLH
jgi:hypothetical protein